MLVGRWVLIEAMNVPLGSSLATEVERFADGTVKAFFPGNSNPVYGNWSVSNGSITVIPHQHTGEPTILNQSTNYFELSDNRLTLILDRDIGYIGIYELIVPGY